MMTRKKAKVVMRELIDSSEEIISLLESSNSGIETHRLKMAIKKARGVLPS